ncbi:unnamed protein product [Anisakis simplex]|uniref:LAM_G_DOMAIN domain-containing protein n=1 Tax=Anisakis simplex TaxID=6269 RepID=A0A0M3JSC0_ANISI|nr:unnamed protein product [Anisakis simplex]
MNLLKHLLLAIFFTSAAFAQNDVPSKLLTLQKDTSFVTLSSIAWNLSEDGDQLIVPIRFRTRASKGRLFTLTGNDAATGSPLFTLSAYVQSSSIIIDVTNGDDSLLKRTDRQLPEANNGEEHSMSLHFNPVSKQLKVVFGQGTTDSYDQIEGIQTKPQIDLTLTAGSYGDHKGIVGCVTLVALSVGKRFALDFPETERSDEGVIDGCESLCDNHECNEVKIDYRLAEIKRALNKRLQTATNEGVLIHSNLLSATDGTSLGDFHLALIYENLHLTLGNLTEATLENVHLSPDNFHELVLTFDYGMSEVQLSLDGNITTASWYKPGKEIDISFGKEVLFTAGADEIGLSACLRQIYYGYFDVIDGYLRNSTKVKASEQLERCETSSATSLSDLQLLSPIHDDGLVEANDIPAEGLWAYEQKQKVLTPDEEEVLDSDADAFNDKVEDEMHETNKLVEDHISDHLSDKFVAVGYSRNILKKYVLYSSHVADIDMICNFQEMPEKKQLCENSEATFCKNHIECIKKGNIPVCVCKKGFAGEHCQFSTLPWNCDDVLTSGNTEPGTYIIDVDGSGPLLETYVNCQNGKTIIPHNMPNQTLMRAKDLGDLRFRINYRLFNEDQLRHLRDFSEECTQTMRYECVKAPLGFSWRKTWFTSLYDHEFSRLMDAGGSCQCANGQCGKCNCDSGQETSDFGTMLGIDAPVTNIYALNDPTDQRGLVTLSSLVCSGSAGRAQTHTATFRSRADSLALGDWDMRSLSFEFRTFEKELTILSSKDDVFDLELQDRTLHLLIDNFNVSLTPQSRLNNGEWHRVRIEILENTVRLSVRESAEYLPVGRPLSSTKIAIFVGGGRHGFLGCIRQIVFNAGKLMNIEALLFNEASIRLGCEDRCATHMCQHESRCEQDFENDAVRCVCRNNIIHSGPLCENSINQGSEVSLHNLKRGFLKVQMSSTSDAVKQRIVVSVRTDRRDALIIYMHDHLYNFVQVHLSDHTRIVLTTNYNRTVRQCEIVAKIGHGKYFECSLTKQAIQNYKDLFLDIVEPPVTPLKRKDDNQPFTLLFVGGLPTENYKGKLDPTYKTTVSTLLGCVRGLMIGDEVINLRDHKYWPYYPKEIDVIREGCKTGCEAIEPTCKNDGHCTFKWTNTDPSAELATCDCTRTSYYGKYCDKDAGAKFNGNALLRFNVGNILKQVIYDWSKIGEQTFDFAFATEPDSPRPQQLVTVHFTNNRLLEAILCKNGSLNVVISSPDSTYVHTFPFNYTDGYRHFFQSEFGGKTPLTITVDSSKFDFPSEVARTLSLANAIDYDFGGIMQSGTGAVAADYHVTAVDSSSQIHNYSGCISNIDINLNVGRMHFKPSIYLIDPSEEFAYGWTIFGDKPLLGNCSAFKIPGALPALQNNVNEPEWDSPFHAEVFYRPTQPVPATTTPPEGQSYWWIILLLIGFILLLILIILLICCCRKKKKEPEPEEGIPMGPKDKVNGGGNIPETAPLLPSGVIIEKPSKLVNNFDLPEPTQSLDRPYYNSPLQQKVSTSSSTTYFTAKQSFDTNDLASVPQANEMDFDDLDTTLKDYDEDATMLPDANDLSGFNRSDPQRLSSFKKGDPTVPHDSPLYRASNARPQPKPVACPESPVL